MGEQNGVALEIANLRDREEAEQLQENLSEFGIREEAMSIRE